MKKKKYKRVTNLVWKIYFDLSLLIRIHVKVTYTRCSTLAHFILEWVDRVHNVTKSKHLQ